MRLLDIHLEVDRPLHLDLHPLNKPEVFASSFAGGFDAAGNLTDEKIAGLVGDQMQALAAWTKRLKG